MVAGGIPSTRRAAIVVPFLGLPAALGVSLLTVDAIQGATLAPEHPALAVAATHVVDAGTIRIAGLRGSLAFVQAYRRSAFAVLADISRKALTANAAAAVIAALLVGTVRHTVDAVPVDTGVSDGT